MFMFDINVVVVVRRKLFCTLVNNEFVCCRFVEFNQFEEEENCGLA